MAASRALATVIPPEDLGPEYVIPGVFNRDVGPRVAAAVAEAAEHDGVARRVRGVTPTSGGAGAPPTRSAAPRAD